MFFARVEKASGLMRLCLCYYRPSMDMPHQPFDMDELYQRVVSSLQRYQREIADLF